MKFYFLVCERSLAFLFGSPSPGLKLKTSAYAKRNGKACWVSFSVSAEATSMHAPVCVGPISLPISAIVCVHLPRLVERAKTLHVLLDKRREQRKDLDHHSPCTPLGFNKSSVQEDTTPVQAAPPAWGGDSFSRPDASCGRHAPASKGKTASGECVTERTDGLARENSAKQEVF